MHTYNLRLINYFLLLFAFIFIKNLYADTNANLDTTNKNNTKILTMNDITKTNIDIYSNKTYITQQFKCTINNDDLVKLEFNIYELSNAELQVFFDDGTNLISASQVNYTYESLGNDLLFRNWIGKPVDILGGGLGATVAGTLIKYENKKAFVKGSNGRFYLVNFEDPQGVRIFLKKDIDDDSYYYKHIITTKFPNLKNQQGNLLVKYKTKMITSDVYYSFYKKNINHIDLDLRALIKNNTSVEFYNPDINIFSDNCILSLLKDDNTKNDSSTKIFNTPTIKVKDNSLNLLKAKNIHDILIKTYKSVNTEEIRIVDMANEKHKKQENLKTITRGYLLNSSEIFPNAKVIISAIQEDLIIDSSSSKYLFHNKHIDKKYIALDKDKNISIQNSINTDADKNNISVFESEKTFWNAVIQNKHNKPINLYLIYSNKDIIGNVESGKLISNNCINVKVPAKSNKEINYSKSLL